MANRNFTAITSVCPSKRLSATNGLANTGSARVSRPRRYADRRSPFALGLRHPFNYPWTRGDLRSVPVRGRETRAQRAVPRQFTRML